MNPRALHILAHDRHAACERCSGRIAVNGCRHLNRRPRVTEPRERCPLNRWPGVLSASLRALVMQRPRFRALRGAIGWIKYALRIDRPRSGVVRNRRLMCGDCQHGGVTCGLCNCRLRIKTAVASEQCPMSNPRWTAMRKGWVEATQVITGCGCKGAQ